MTESLRQCTLISNLMTGKHEDLHVYFEDFADLVKDECLDTNSWQEKSAELLGLEITIELYMEAHPNATAISKMLVGKIIDFIRRMQDHFGECYSNRANPRHSFFPETQPHITAQKGVGDNSSRSKANISVVDGVEFIYGCHGTSSCRL